MLSVKLRTRVKVQGKSAFENKCGGSLSLSAVHSVDPECVNRVLSDDTPWLHVSIAIYKQDAFEFYKTGKEYYLDFIPVEEAK